jgi:phosphatidylinositol glycan class H protein
VRFRALLVFGPLIVTYIESVVVIPSQGIQFETHQGLKSRSLISSRRFIPFASLEDVVINEALHRWNVRFYLVAIRQVGAHGHRLEVAFEVSLFLLFRYGG